MRNFLGNDYDVKKERPETIEPPLFTKTGWANMKTKYGKEVKLAGPLYTKTGLKDWVGWGDKWSLADSNFTDAPMYTKGFWEGIAFEIEPEKVEKIITVMETNEEGEQVEVQKKVMEDVKYPPIYTKSFWNPVIRAKE